MSEPAHERDEARDAPDGWDEPLAPGLTIGDRYDLVRQLGQGATGVVWEATHRVLTKSVAIKFLSSAGRQTSELTLERFRYEAQVSARLAETTHHIVAVHDAALHRGVPYIVMDLAVGEALDARLERTALSVEELRVVIRQIGRALQAAHKAGIVHRDVKPGNILCIERAPSSEPLYKLTDFGVAKSFGDRLAGPLQPRQTTAGLLVGSPAYMSPEQVAGSQHVDGSADVWALAVVAYESLSQRLPFDGSAITELALAIVQGRAEPIRSLAPGLPFGLDAFFQRAFSPSRAERFTTIEDLTDAFEAALVAEPPAELPAAAAPELTSLGEGDHAVPLVSDGDSLDAVSRRRLSPWILVGLGLSVICVIAAGALIFGRPVGQDAQNGESRDVRAEPNTLDAPTMEEADARATVPTSAPTGVALSSLPPASEDTPSPSASSSAQPASTPGLRVPPRKMNQSEVY